MNFPPKWKGDPLTGDIQCPPSLKYIHLPSPNSLRRRLVSSFAAILEVPLLHLDLSTLSTRSIWGAVRVPLAGIPKMWSHSCEEEAEGRLLFSAAIPPKVYGNVDPFAEHPLLGVGPQCKSGRYHIAAMSADTASVEPRVQCTNQE